MYLGGILADEHRNAPVWLRDVRGFYIMKAGLGVQGFNGVAALESTSGGEGMPCTWNRHVHLGLVWPRSRYY